MNILYLIPARGGSKGIPQKNIKLLRGKPLICYAIDNALELTSYENICVSTDDCDIKRIVENYGLHVPFIRPSELAADNSGMNEVLLHALNYYKSIGTEYEVIVLLQPTSPLRKSSNIKDALKLFDFSIDMVVSVKRAASNPYYNLFEDDDNGFLQQSKIGNFIRRQDVPSVWEMNGAIYVINAHTLEEKGLDNFSKIRKYIMNPLESVDIDSSIDWEFAEFLMNKSNKC